MSKPGKRKPYKIYTKAFKLEAVRLMESSDRPASEVAMQLGIRRNQLYKWKEQVQKQADGGTGKRGRPRKDNQSELARLRQENKRLQEENDILKKAAASSIGRCNTSIKSIRRGIVPQCLPGSLIQSTGHAV